jgi:DNA (cytosine-5)-methyltransferase 1
MKSLKVLDLCCGAGGASEGYYRAGFDVVGVDHVKQPHYKFKFILADALPYLINNWLRIEAEFDLITGGPPCQKYSDLTPDAYKAGHSDMLEHVLAFLRTKNKPYIIENVSGARRHMINPVMLCGSMFGLPIWRHRYFENNLGIFQSPAGCAHYPDPVIITGMTKKLRNGKRPQNTAEEKRAAMGIDWMTEKEVTQAIPPVFTHWLGLKAIEHLQKAVA